jgi:hypothetical protein
VKIKVWPWLAGAAMSVAALGTLFWSRSRTEKNLRAPATALEVDELRDRVAGLEHALASNENRYAMPPGVPSPAVQLPSASNISQRSEPKKSRRLSDEEEREVNDRRIQRFGDLLGREARDESWAPGYEESLRVAVRASASDDGATELESVACRTTICRLVLTAVSSEAQRRFMSDFHRQLPPMAAVHFSEVVGQNGSSTMTWDFVRTGYATTVIDGPVDEPR